MAAEAPGSWEHARAMANLAEASAAAIGADALLTRVGAYYHDLGKTVQPKYFIENLAPGERSPHEELDPDVSADAIMAHVVMGTKILREGNIPEPVVEFAYTHHGTQVVEYFWHKCAEHGNPKDLTQEHFRYPGMKPQTKETAILMLVDSIEAASRTIWPPEHKKFEEMIQRVIVHRSFAPRPARRVRADDRGPAHHDEPHGVDASSTCTPRAHRVPVAARRDRARHTPCAADGHRRTATRPAPTAHARPERPRAGRDEALSPPLLEHRKEPACLLTGAPAPPSSSARAPPRPSSSTRPGRPAKDERRQASPCGRRGRRMSRPGAPRAPAEAERPAPGKDGPMPPTIEQSFMKALFHGIIAEDIIFPYPEMPAEDRETTSMILDSVRRFFASSVDGGRIDREHAIDPGPRRR